MQIQQHNGLLPTAAFTHPAPTETLCCDLLVVGDGITAYAATLSALEAGARVCLVQPSTIVAKPWVLKANLSADDHRLIRRPSFWKQITGEDFAISRRYKHLRDRHRHLTQTLRDRPTAIAQPLTVALSTAINDTLLPGLNHGNLMIIPNAVPQLVLTAREKEAPQRIVQVMFRRPQDQTRFTVHSKLTIDGTATGELSRLVHDSADRAMTPLPTPASWPAPTRWAQGVRGIHAAHSVGLVYAESPARMAAAPPPTASAKFGFLNQWLDQRVASKPCTLPMELLIAQQVAEFILAPTHLDAITHCPGLSQTQPLQWAWGEAAGALAAQAQQRGISLREFGQIPEAMLALQHHLIQQGVPLYWFDDVGHHDPDFAAIQMMALQGIVRTASDRDLHFRPDTLVSRAVLATALVNFWDGDRLNPSTPTFQDVNRHHWAYRAIETAVANGWMGGDTPTTFVPSRVLNRRQCYQIMQRLAPQAIETLFAHTPIDGDALRRRDLARILCNLFNAPEGV